MKRHPRISTLPIGIILIALTLVISGAGEPQPKAQCAAGCSVAGPPAAELSPAKIASCLGQIANQPLGEASLELETLLFHAGQVVPYLQDKGMAPLNSEQARFLKRELARTHAHIRLRIVDAEGNERMTFDRLVPIGVKQHLHAKEAQGFAPPEISFTIHRVGLHHLWSRL